MNKNFRILVCAFVVAVLFFGCASRHAKAPTPTLTQVSTISALLSGDYDGSVTLGELLAFGDTGSGTFQALDGEMIILDGRVYQVTAEGEVRTPPMTTLTPFATIAPFFATNTAEITTPTDFEGLAEKALALWPNPDVFCAVKAHGHFSKMKTRVPAAQEKPYPPLTEATRFQQEFSLADVTGTIVGFYSPWFAGGVTVPGFHLHFLSDNHKSGGHVLSFSMDKGELSVMPIYRVSLLLPKKAFSKEADRGRDQNKEIRQAEGDR